MVLIKLNAFEDLKYRYDIKVAGEPCRQSGDIR